MNILSKVEGYYVEKHEKVCLIQQRYMRYIFQQRYMRYIYIFSLILCCIFQ